MGHPRLSTHLYDRIRLLTPRVQFSIDLPYHPSRLGYQLHTLHHTQFTLHRLWRGHLLLILDPEPRQLRHITPLGMPLSEVLQTLMTARLLSSLAPRPLPQFVHPHFRMDLHCAYHQGPGHTTDQCTALRHVVQDLIDQGIVQLGQPSISSNPLPTYSTHAVPPPVGGIHSIDFVEFEDRIHMLS